jgi:hypothetical protein
MPAPRKSVAIGKQFRQAADPGRAAATATPFYIGINITGKNGSP